MESTEKPAAQPVEKHPEVRALFRALQEEKAALLARTAALHQRYDELQATIAPLEAEQREVARQFHAIERPRLGEIEQQLSALARAMGGRRLSDSAPTG